MLTSTRGRHDVRSRVTDAVGLVKVPEITMLFWVVKILTTGMGEAASDFLGNLNLALAGVVGIGGLVIALRRQFRAPAYHAPTYWSAVAMVAVFGTMVADVLHIALSVSYWVTTGVYAAAVALILTLWHRSEGTLSIHSIVTRRRERYYWATVLATFALGTAVGDLTATTLHLGFFASGVLFLAGIVVVAALWKAGLPGVPAFWCAYVITRPLGASFADWVGKPHSFGGGLGYGDGTVTGISLAVIVVLVGYLWVTGCDVIGGRYGRRPAAALTPDDALAYPTTRAELDLWP